MKMIVVTHEDAYNRTKSVLQKTYSDLEMSFVRFEPTSLEFTFKELALKQRDADCVLFTGYIPHTMCLHLKEAGVPWGYVKRSENMILGAICKALLTGKYDITRISIDRISLASCPPDIMEEIMNKLDISTSALNHIYIETSLNNPNYVKEIVQAHEKNVRSKKSSFALTGVTPIYLKLKEKNIPCIFLGFDADDLIRTVNNLLSHNVQIDDKNYMQTILIGFNNESEMWRQTSKRERLKQLEFTEHIYRFSDTMMGALWQLSDNKIVIMSNPDDMDAKQEVELLENLLFSAEQIGMEINIGIGVSKLATDSQKLAIKAYNSALSHRGCCAYIANRFGEYIGPVYAHKNPSSLSGNRYLNENFISKIAMSTGISEKAMGDLIEFAQKRKFNPFTVSEFAKYCVVSNRHASNQLKKFLENKIINDVGRMVYYEGGRPARLYSVDYDYLLSW